MISDQYEQEDFFEYDIAMILLTQPFDLSNSDPKIMPVCLPNTKYLGTVNIDSIGKNQKIIIMGTGKIKEGSYPQILQFAKVNLVHTDDCYRKWCSTLKLDSEIKKVGFCVRGKNKEVPCAGDSGAPAILKQDNKDYLIGINYAGQIKCGTQWLRSTSSNSCIPKPKKSNRPNYYNKIPGMVLEWILKIGGKDIKNEQKEMKC